MDTDGHGCEQGNDTTVRNRDTNREGTGTQTERGQEHKRTGTQTNRLRGRYTD